MILIVQYSGNLSLPTPPQYGYLSITDSTLGPKDTKIHTIPTPYLYNTDTFKTPTLWSVPLVSVLRRFDFTWLKIVQGDVTGILLLLVNTRIINFTIEWFSIECRKQFRDCFGFALLRFVIG